MYRGTTPTLTIKVDIPPNNFDINRTYITIKCGGSLLDFTGDDITILEDEGAFQIVLSQQQTLKLRDNKVEIQIRGTLSDGETVVASNIMETTSQKILKEGVI